MKKIFLTGAAGFVGFHLVKKLIARGDEVVGFDNFNDYYDPKLKRAREKALGIEIIEGDLCADLEKAIPDDVTHIVHLAAQAGVRYSIDNPHAYLKSNLEGFLNVLEACRARRGVPLTYASSSSVYGLNTSIPFSLGDRTDKQASLYGATKKSNELMAGTYHHLYDISVTGLRFFTVYGPWGRPDMAYYSFTDAIAKGKPIKVFAEGTLKRDFTYIDDIVSGTIAAIDLAAPCEIFNLGNCEPITVNELVATIESAVGKKASIEPHPMQPGDVVTTFADISHSEKLLGYKPTTSITEGINHFVDWYRSYQS